MRSMDLRPILNRWFSGLLGLMLALGTPASADSPYQYQLYLNSENFGIVIFPSDRIYPELEDYIRSLGFDPAETGDAVMRYGSKGENATYMMPEEVQKKHNLKKFIILQILEDRQSLMVGIEEEEFGLTLPSLVFQLDAIKEKIPQTLEVFRGRSGNSKKEIRWHFPEIWYSVMKQPHFRYVPIKGKEATDYADLRVRMRKM